MHPEAELATHVPTLENGEAVMVGDGADQHLETTFHLRQNATFSDGTPVTADDVVFSWKLSLNPGWPDRLATIWSRNTHDVVAVDPHTVVFKMKPSVIHPLYLYGLPGTSGSIRPSASARSSTSTRRTRQKSPTCSRACTVASPSASDPTPSTAGILAFRWSCTPAPTTTAASRPSTRSSSAASGRRRGRLLAQLQAGEIQTLGSDTLDASDVDTVNAIPGVTAYVRAGTSVEHIDFNLQNPMLADKQVRLCDRVCDRPPGPGQPRAGRPISAADSFIPPISQFFDDNTPRYPFNPNQARSILEADGWTPGADGIRVNAQGQRFEL